VSTPVRQIDLVAGGVAASFGAGLFLGLAPAASLAGRSLPAAVALAAVIGGLAVLSIRERPLTTASAPVRRLGFALETLGRLVAGVAIAGTVASYLSPLAAVVVVVVVVAAAVVEVPPACHLVAAVVVLAVLGIVVAACFTIDPVAPAVAAPDGGSVVGVLAATGLLTVCFFGADAVTRPDATRAPDRARLGVVVALGVVAVVCLAVAFAALRQLGASRLAASPAPLRDVLAAADATAISRLLVVGVVVGCGFALLGVVRGLHAPGVPRLRLAVAAGLVAVLGALYVPPAAALAGAAVLLLCAAAFRAIAVRR
jgi:basic amino acid/polyamine antiporter, APA family